MQQIVKVFNGHSKVYYHRNELYSMGLRFQKRAYGKSFYEIKTKDMELVAAIKDFCSKKKLKVQIIDAAFTRSSNYRKKFFETQKPDFGNRYFCAYCGKLLPQSKIQIDHLVPVDRASNSLFLQKRLRLMGTSDINDISNLLPSCAHCNNHKRSRMGFWIVRGRIGQYKYLWCLRWALRATITIVSFVILIDFMIKYFL